MKKLLVIIITLFFILPNIPAQAGHHKYCSHSHKNHHRQIPKHKHKHKPVRPLCIDFVGTLYCPDRHLPTNKIIQYHPYSYPHYRHQHCGSRAI